MKKGKKKYLIFIAIVIVYVIITCFFYVKRKNDYINIVVRDDVVWSYQNKKWEKISLEKNDEIEKLNWTKFVIYSDGKKLGKYNLWYDEKWYAFNDNNKAINYDGELFAYQSPKHIKALSFKNKEINDFTYVETLLKNNNITTDGNYTMSNNISVDFDSDGQKEEFYLVSNVFSEKLEGNHYTFVFMVKNNKIYEIYKDTNIKDTYDGCMPYIDGFIDVDKDSKYEIAFTCSKYSIKKPINKLYKFKKGKFEEIISN